MRGILRKRQKTVADTGASAIMERDGSRLFDIRPHQGSVQGFDGSTQSSTSFGKMKVQTSDGTKILNNVWIVRSLSESLFSIPELVLQLKMLILFSTDGAFEVKKSKDNTLILGQQICDFDVKSKTWTMAKGFICPPSVNDRSVVSSSQARVATSANTVGFPAFALSDRMAVNRKDSFTPEHRAHLMHLRSGCLSRSGMIEVVRRKCIRNYNCTVEEITRCIGKNTPFTCYGCIFCTNKLPMVSRTRGVANPGSTYRNIPDSENPPGDNSIGTDTFGPLPEDWLGNKWAQIFIHCKHRVIWVYSMKSRSDYFEVLKQFLTSYKRTFPSNSLPEVYRSNYVAIFEGDMINSFQILRSDNAPELVSAQVDSLLEERLLLMHKTIPHSSHLNGITERAIQTVQNITEAQLANAKFTDHEREEMYHRALRHASGVVYNFLRPHRSLGYITPFQSWTGIIPHADWFRVFGCTAYVYLEHSERPSGKRSRPYVPGIYVGVDPNTLGSSPSHLLYIPSKEKLFVRHSVVFNETMTHDSDRFARLKAGEIYVDNLQREELISSLQNHPIFKDLNSDISAIHDDGPDTNDTSASSISPTSIHTVDTAGVINTDEVRSSPLIHGADISTTDESLVPNTSSASIPTTVTSGDGNTYEETDIFLTEGDHIDTTISSANRSSDISAIDKSVVTNSSSASIPTTVTSGDGNTCAETDIFLTEGARIDTTISSANRSSSMSIRNNVTDGNITLSTEVAEGCYPSSPWFVEGLSQRTLTKEQELKAKATARVAKSSSPPTYSQQEHCLRWNTSRRCRKKRRNKINIDLDLLPLRTTSSDKGFAHICQEWARQVLAAHKVQVHAIHKTRLAAARRVSLKRPKLKDLPTSFSDDVKLSEWDNPFLQWARRRDDWPLWEEAIRKELEQLEARGTWRQLYDGEVPKNRPLGTKLVLKIKRLPDGSIDKYKARLTVQGFLQRYGIDYTKTRSPVTQLATIKMLIAQALRKGRKCKLVDFAGAFLYPFLKEELYITAPNLLGKGDVILKLIKSLYGLKQASREWFLALRDALLAIGFIQMPQEVDECLFYHASLDIWIAAYVDDSFVSYVDEDSLSSVLDQLKAKNFEFSTVEELNKGLGLQITRTDDYVFVNQPNYIRFIMDEFNIPAINKPTPIVKWFDPRHDDEKPFTPDEKTRFQSLLGALSHLARMTRPEALLAVFHIATFTGDPCQRHYNGLVRIAQHLATDPMRGIRFTKDAPLWEFYCDSDWAGCPTTRRSTEGYIIKFMGGPLIAVSRRQRNVTKSSCEAEYCTFADCAADIIWAKSLAAAFNCEFPEPAILRCDNQTAIAMAEGEVALKRTKHIDAFRKHVGVKYHWIRELVDFGIISLAHVSGLENHADILTKPNPRAVFAPAAKHLLNETDEFLHSFSQVALAKIAAARSLALAYRSKVYPVAPLHGDFMPGDPTSDSVQGIQHCLRCCVLAA